VVQQPTTNNQQPTTKLKTTRDLSPFDCTVLPELSHPDATVAGVDEVGRGALFGPVVAAAIVLPVSSLPELTAIGVKDSKLLSAKKRRELAAKIKDLVLNWQIGSVDSQEIDRINIFQASLQAMGGAVSSLKPLPSLCLVDGRHPLPNLDLPQYNLTKGDWRSPVIAAASIIAKVWRDDLIICYADDYPDYDLAANKGYGTSRHLEALVKYGASPLHRLSFRPCRLSHRPLTIDQR
jgi:ribonuclease HII